MSNPNNFSKESLAQQIAEDMKSKAQITIPASAMTFALMNLRKAELLSEYAARFTPKKFTPDTNAITCTGDRHTEATGYRECDEWHCTCGNEAHLDGFFSTDKYGNETVEYTGLLCCAGCGATYDENGRNVAR